MTENKFKRGDLVKLWSVGKPPKGLVLRQDEEWKERYIVWFFGAEKPMSIHRARLVLWKKK